jgi:hypothetical protein
MALWTPNNIINEKWLKKGHWNLDGSGLVEQMNDLSGNGRHYIQPDATKRPAVNANGDLDTTGAKFLYNSDPVCAALSATTGVMVFMVVQFTDTSAGIAYIEQSDPVTNFRYTHHYWEQNYLKTWIIGGASSTDYGVNRATVSGYTPANHKYVHSIIDNVRDVVGRTSGIHARAFDYPAPSGAMDADVSVIGGYKVSTWVNSSKAMLMSELLVVKYDPDLIPIIEGYLHHEHGLTARLPADHPYKTTPPEGPDYPTLTAPLPKLSSTVNNANVSTLWEPLELGPDLWFDAGAPNTLVLDGAMVLRWYDKINLEVYGAPAGGEGSIVSPTYVTGAEDSLNVVNYYERRANLKLHNASEILGNTDGFSVYVLANKSMREYPLLQIGTLFQLSFHSTSNVLLYAQGETSALQSLRTEGWTAGAGMANYVTGETYTSTDGKITERTIGTTTHTPATPALVVNDIYIGGDGVQWDTWRGDISDILVFRRILSQEEEDQLFGYLMWKKGANAKLPLDHPYYDAPPESTPPAPDNFIDVDLLPATPAINSLVINEAPHKESFLLQSETADSSVDFVDSSEHNIAIYPSGSVSHSTESAKFGASSIKFPESGHPSLRTEPHPGIVLGAGDWTIDFWIRIPSPGQLSRTIFQIDRGTEGTKARLATGGDYPYRLIWWQDGDNAISSLRLGYWNHIAIVKLGGVIQLYRDGGINGYHGPFPSLPVNNNQTYDGDELVIDPGLEIFIEEFRITPSARWMGPFTPATEPVEPPPRFLVAYNTPVPAVSGITINNAPRRTFSNCVPWRVQPFNGVDPIPSPYPSVTTETPLADTRAGGCAAVTDNKVYIIGGYPNSAGNEIPMPALVADINPDGTISSWSEVPGIATPRCKAEVFRTPNRLYVVGGGLSYGQNPTASVDYYNIRSDGTLEPIAHPSQSMNEARQGFGLVVTKNRVYAIGGAGTVAKTTVEYSDIGVSEELHPWAYGPPLPIALRFTTVVYTGTKVYVFGSAPILDTPDNIFDYTAYCYSADVLEYGVVGDWTYEWHHNNIYINLNVVQTKNFLCLLTSSYEAGVWASGFEGSLWTVRKWPISAGGIIDFTPEYTGIQFTPESWDSAFFITSSRLYQVGGYAALVSGGEGLVLVQNPQATNKVNSIPFTGGANNYDQYNYIDEVTPVVFSGELAPPKAHVHSYFGSWEFCNGNVEAPVPQLDAWATPLYFINAEVKTPIAQVDAYVHYTRFADTNIAAPAPEVSSYLWSGLMIYGAMEPFVMEAYSAYRSNDMDIAIRPLDAIMTGDNMYSEIKAGAVALTAEMFCGSGMAAELEEPTADIRAVVGQTGSINCRMAQVMVAIRGGPPPFFSAALQQMDMAATGDNDNVSGISLRLTPPSLVMAGESEIVASITAALAPARVDMEQLLRHQVGSIGASLRPVSAQISTLSYNAAHLDARLSAIRADMWAYRLSACAVEATTEYCSALMAGSNVGPGEELGAAGCDLAEDLVFGG